MSNKKKGVEFINDTMAYSHDHGVIFSLAAPEPVVSPVAPKPKDVAGGSDSKLATWGDNNDFPQQVLKKIEKSTELPALLDFKARLIQGKEVIAVQMIYDPAKKDFVTVRIEDQEINDYLASTAFKRYWREASTDFVYFHNIFPDMIKSTGADKIAYIGTHEAAWCRWEIMNNEGTIEKLYVCPDWDTSKIGDPNVKPHSVVDPYDPLIVDKVKALGNKLQRFVFPAQYSSPGRAYYALAPFTSFLNSPWYDLTQLIPESKVTLMKKALSAKYMLSIPLNYWPSAYKGWSKLSPEDQRDIREKKVNEVNDNLTGVKNTGNTILCDYGKDFNGQEIPVWKIEPIQNALNDGEGLEDSREASEHLRISLGMDSALVGDGPGKKMGAGSGSDKRIAFNIQVAMLQPYRDVILEPVYFKADYDGWRNKYPGFRFLVKEIELETLDKTKSTSNEKAA